MLNVNIFISYCRKLLNTQVGWVMIPFVDVSSYFVMFNMNDFANCNAILLQGYNATSVPSNKSCIHQVWASKNVSEYTAGKLDSGKALSLTKTTAACGSPFCLSILSNFFLFS
jgi:hypothetical protein